MCEKTILSDVFHNNQFSLVFNKSPILLFHFSVSNLAEKFQRVARIPQRA